MIRLAQLHPNKKSVFFCHYSLPREAESLRKDQCHLPVAITMSTTSSSRSPTVPTPRRSPMIETRIASRHRVSKAARIEFGTSAIDCMVRDLSVTGAAIEVSSQTGIPEKFTLVVPGDGLRLPCTVIRRAAYRIGVTFD
jgi:hypothetical protein